MAHHQYQFLPFEHYQFWHRRRRSKLQNVSVLQGRNWVSRLLISDEVGDRPEWAAEVSHQEGRTVSPILLQQCHIHEVVWFSGQQPVSQSEFHILRSKFGSLQFAVHPDRKAIHVRQDGKLVALIWPCTGPSPDAKSAMRHELALRSPPPKDAGQLKALVIAHLEPFRHGPVEKQWQAANRLLDWLERKPECSYVWASEGIIEWRECAAIEVIDGVVFQFKGTGVNLTRFFAGLERGRTVAEFLEENPTVSKQQVDTVLDHVYRSLCI